jgi:opacity protein-like surface antigen
MKSLLAMLAATVMVLSASAAFAADYGRGGSIKDEPIADVPTHKFYLAVRGGFAFPEDTEFGALSTTITNEYDTSYFIGGAAGITNLLGVRGLRGDLEIGYRSAEVEAHNVGGVKFSGANAFGSTDTVYGLASIYYDFQTGTIFKPFIGAGGGIADVSFDQHGVSTARNVLDDNATAYAWHVTAGTNVELAAGLNLEVAYRYFSTVGAEVTAFDGTKSDVDVNDHQIMIGLRRNF